MREREFYRGRRLPFWIERESFESVRGVVWRDQEREFWQRERDWLKGSRERVLTAWEGLFSGIQKKRVFWEWREVIWMDRCREFLRAERGCLKRSVHVVFESGERLFEGISAWNFLEWREAVWRDRSREFLREEKGYLKGLAQRGGCLKGLARSSWEWRKVAVWKNR